MPQCDDAAVERIVTDDPTIPALLDQLITRDDFRLRGGEGDENLRNFRLEFATLARHVNLATGRTDAQPSQIEIRLFCQLDPGGIHLKGLNSASSAIHHRNIALPT
jgi:hypothetical protein